MTFIGIVLGVVGGVVLLGVGGFFLIRGRIKNFLGDSDFNLLRDMLKNGEYETADEAYTNDKSISGMTAIYEPQIRQDFSDFNLSLLYSTIEKNIRAILNAKTNLDISYLDNDQLLFIKNNVIKEIDDMKVNEIKVSYKDISFNKHVIRGYTKKNGTATITTASQVNYYYDSNKKDKKRNNLKKSTIYVCDFIYVYDEGKFRDEQKTIAINCPNCGAPLAGLDGGTCVYCGTYAKPINLKAWKMSSYKEESR